MVAMFTMPENNRYVSNDDQLLLDVEERDVLRIITTKGLGTSSTRIQEVFH